MLAANISQVAFAVCYLRAARRGLLAASGAGRAGFAVSTLELAWLRLPLVAALTGVLTALTAGLWLAGRLQQAALYTGSSRSRCQGAAAEHPGTHGHRDRGGDRDHPGWPVLGLALSGLISPIPACCLDFSCADDRATVSLLRHTMWR